MPGNVGTTDRILRIAIGVALLAMFFLFEGGLRLFGLIGLIPLVTGLLGSCPLYCAVGLSTRTSKASDQ
ncbi:MAG: YgaP family membrane protein [Rhizobiaceae bacterium]